MSEAQELLMAVLRETSSKTVRFDGEWYFTFDNESVLRAGCLWRLIVKRRVALSGDDHMQKFGLDVPVDAAQSAMQILSGKHVEGVHLDEGTADIRIEFSDGTSLEFVKDSSGYDPWGISSQRINLFADGSEGVFSMEPKPPDSKSPRNVFQLGDGFRKVSGNI